VVGFSLMRHGGGAVPDSALTLKGEHGEPIGDEASALSAGAPQVDWMTDDPLEHLRDDANEAIVNRGHDVVDKVEPFVTFYAYRPAAGQDDDEIENTVVMDLAAALSYVHRWVVSTSPRLKGIDRIKRWQVTTRTTREYFNAKDGRSFGWFWNFTDGQCVDEQCYDFYRHFGLIVGCGWAPHDEAHQAAYRSFAPAYPDKKDKNIADDATRVPLYWSLPGECPSAGKDKDVNCKDNLPGGRCSMAVGAPDCTWSATDAGEILLDELAEIEDYSSFASGNNQEYDLDSDAGRGTEFWNGMNDRNKCDYRMNKAEGLFAKKYKEFASRMVEPPCDAVDVPIGELWAPPDHRGALKPLRGFHWNV
jgi:hypothetical protein